VGGRARIDKKGRRHRLAGGGPGSSDVASVKAPPQVGVLLGGRLLRPFLFSAFVTTLHVANISTVRERLRTNKRYVIETSRFYIVGKAGNIH